MAASKQRRDPGEDPGEGQLFALQFNPWLLILGYRQVKEYLSRKTLLIIWISINCLVFWLSYRNYKHNPRYFYIHRMLGSGLCLSRGTASVLNLACFMIFIPMCRTLMTWMRSLCSEQPSITPQCPVKSSSCSWTSSSTLPTTVAPNAPSTGWQAKWKRRRQRWLPLSLSLPPLPFVVSFVDQSQKFHIICAATIIFAAACHSVAHIVNAYNFSRNYNHQYPEINVAQFSGQNPLTMMFYSMPGFTGLLMVLVILFLAVFASERIRSRYFDLFWFSHRLYILFVVLLLIHPLGGLLKEQINTDKHWPGCNATRVMRHEQRVAPNASQWLESWSQEMPENETINATKAEGREQENCEEPPLFSPLKSNTWKWLAAALTIYGADLGMRLIRRRHATDILNARVHEKSDVIELQLASGASDKSSYWARAGAPGPPTPGQYVYIKCPQISVIEWHPFSLTSSSSNWSQGSYSLHVRAAGDWSNKLKEVTKATPSPSLVTGSRSPEVNMYMDGPFCSPIQDVLSYRVSVCIAGGIGVTPFSSILTFINSPSFEPEKFKLKKVHFIWISRNRESFQCFAQMLTQLYAELKKSNRQELVDMRLYSTEEVSDDRRLIEQPFGGPSSLNEDDKRFEETVEGFLERRLEVGRPNWPQLFEGLENLYKPFKSKVGVFCCGPRGLRKQIKQICRKANVRGARFVLKPGDFGY